MLLLKHTNRFERCLSTGSALFALFGSGFALKGEKARLLVGVRLFNLHIVTFL